MTMLTITISRPRHMRAEQEDVPTASHVILHSPADGILLLRRVGEDYGGHWGLPGGSIEPGESPLVALIREVREEIGVDLKAIPHAVNRITALDVSMGSQAHVLGMTTFEPDLNDEHDQFCWAHPEHLPEPMHPNAEAVVINYFKHFRGFYHG
jgi:8-oxo-dGTP pyrophosphatase MutT (NUDIX family)